MRPESLGQEWGRGGTRPYRAFSFPAHASTPLQSSAVVKPRALASFATFLMPGFRNPRARYNARARKDWGYGATEALSNDDLIAELRPLPADFATRWQAPSASRPPKASITRFRPSARP